MTIAALAVRVAGLERALEELLSRLESADVEESSEIEAAHRTSVARLRERGKAAARPLGGNE